MAEKQPIVVIKKINVQAAGAHGGSWKVAFADFMTSMMAFFLVMWLISQSEQVKKNIADYFSTPSIIEYNFSNYGVELTLEKLFLDLINEPLKFFQAFVTPTDFTPNIMGMGSKKIVLHHIADQLGDIAQNVEVNADEVFFEIPADQLFGYGTAEPQAHFVDVMEKLKAITSGLEDSNVFVDSTIFDQTVRTKDKGDARRVAEQRLDLVSQKIQSSLEHGSVDVFGKSQVKVAGTLAPGQKVDNGVIRFKVKQKDFTKDGRKPRQLDDVFGKSDTDKSPYDNFVNQLTDRKKGDKFDTNDPRARWRARRNK
ncbi:MAG: chemotaxis protein MotB [Bdellovibrionaceae bacterium]|nr:chemotaxis protein MotB [Bdellovibrionales bacterium]MCB9084810.1 chemotaxis protein MotB [Pseudobdellovibrionaceae bacterium]